MTEDEMAAHIERVEAEKERLRDDHRLTGRRLSFDEAVFEASKARLNSYLANASGFPDMPERHELLEKWKSICISQIKEIVNPTVCKLFAQLDPIWGHHNNPGKRFHVMSQDHDLVVPRAKRLVSRLDGRLSGREFKKRYTAILIRTAEQMNTTDWQALARAFYAGYGKGQPA